MNNLAPKIEIQDIDFIEFCAANITDLAPLLVNMGFSQTHVNENRTFALYRQGEITIIVNAIINTPSHYYFKKHGASIYSIGVRTKSDIGQSHSGFSDMVSLRGIGGTVFYLTNENTLSYIMKDLIKVGDNNSNKLKKIDHIAFCVYQGRSRYWEEKLSEQFTMRNVMDFSIAGKHTSFNSRGIINSDDTQRFVISESNDAKSQIAEYLRLHAGEGVQHVAFSSNNITDSVSSLKNSGIEFVGIPASYYDDINNRIPKHNEDIFVLKENNILIDNNKTNTAQILLQTFTKCLLGPMFFEVIERKGNEGFGEGNITALFEAVEREQILKGSLTVDGDVKGNHQHEISR